MNALLISPCFPDTFWSLKYALAFLPAKATIPPLGLLTVGAMLPASWASRLVDMNVRPLRDEDLQWADIAFIGGMAIQAASMAEAIGRCRAAHVKTCGGGVAYATHREDLPPVDHLFLGESEKTLPEFLEDLANGAAKPLYAADAFPDLAATPLTRWDLIDFSDYLTMPLQVSRGCPHECDFCQVAILNGRRPRSKPVPQVLAELEALYGAGWRGPVMFVDDNFIGRKVAAGAILTAIAAWQDRHAYPFFFLSQASVDVADHPEMLALLQRAGFIQLFLGIETPVAASLSECNKRNNLGRDLADAVRVIQAHGMDVLGGFIVGFDADPPSIFEEMVAFIEKAAIPTAMVGVLAAAPGTKLHRRLAAQGRLTGRSDGDSIANLSGMNVIPLMGRERLLAGYKKLLTALYEPEPYYRRVLRFLGRYRPNPWFPSRLPSLREVRAFSGILWALGVKDAARRSFWRFLARVLLTAPPLFPLAVSIIAGGAHYRAMTRRFVATARWHPPLPAAGGGIRFPAALKEAGAAGRDRSGGGGRASSRPVMP